MRPGWGNGEGPAPGPHLVSDLQSRLQEQASLPRREWWERYLRGTASFRGVSMGEVRATVHDWYRDRELSRRSPTDQADVAMDLLRQDLTEDKLAGIVVLQEIVIPSGEPPYRDLLPAFADLFRDGRLADWNSVDWFCVKVLGPLVERDGEPCARAIGEWRGAPTLWQKRAGAVAFVNLVGGEERFPGFRALVFRSCEALVSDPARFSQTGAGWVLRELSVVDAGGVEDFLFAHLDRISREAMRSATRKLPAARRDALLDRHRARASASRPRA